MSSPEKPTILLVHGAWHSSSIWGPLRELLTSHSYPSVAVDLPSPGSAPPCDLQDDVAVVREALMKLIVDEGKEVVLVMHSYGGVVGGASTEGLEKAYREKLEQKGGIVACVFILVFLVGVGQSLFSLFVEPPSWQYLDHDDPRYVHCVDYYASFYSSDVSAEEAAPYTSTMRRQPMTTVFGEVEAAAWTSGLVPCYYLICEQDRAVLPSVQEMMVEEAGKQGHIEWVVERVQAGHSVWLSKPEAVLSLIERAISRKLPVQEAVGYPQEIDP